MLEQSNAKKNGVDETKQRKPLITRIREQAMLPPWLSDPLKEDRLSQDELESFLALVEGKTTVERFRYYQQYTPIPDDFLLDVATDIFEDYDCGVSTMKEDLDAVGRMKALGLMDDRPVTRPSFPPPAFRRKPPLFLRLRRIAHRIAHAL